MLTTPHRAAGRRERGRSTKEKTSPLCACLLLGSLSGPGGTGLELSTQQRSSSAPPQSHQRAQRELWTGLVKATDSFLGRRLDPRLALLH